MARRQFVCRNCMDNGCKLFQAECYVGDPFICPQGMSATWNELCDEGSLPDTEATMPLEKDPDER